MSSLRRLRQVAPILLCAAILPGVAAAQSSYTAFEQVTIDSTAGGVGLTATKIDPAGRPQAQVAICAVENADLRYTKDGTTPTSSVGLPVPAGGSIVLTNHDELARFRAIRTTSVNSQISCSYTSSVAASNGAVASVSGGSSTGVILDGANTTIKATVKTYTNGNPIGTVPFDANGNPVFDAAIGTAITNAPVFVGGIASVAVPATAGTDGNAKGLWLGPRGQAITGLFPSTFPTYTAAKQGLAVAASATDIAVLSGNASTIVVPTMVTLSCVQTTAGITDVQLFIRTTADSGGTSTGSPTTFPLDQNNGAASSAVLTYTANPTVNDGTARLIDVQKVGMLAAATATPSDIYIWRPTMMGQSVVLRGTAQQLAVNLAGVTVTGGSCDVRFTWMEVTGL